MTAIKLSKSPTRQFTNTQCLDVEDKDGNLYRVINTDELHLPFGKGDTLDPINNMAALLESMMVQMGSEQTMTLDASARGGLADIMLTMRGLCALESRNDCPFEFDKDDNVQHIGLKPQSI